MMREEMTKSLPVSKQMVWDSYLKVLKKDGGAGIDRESIEGFNANRNKNLYKIWNRMSSGCYFPPAVRTVFIPKKQGGVRPLGIPTVADRVAQGVVKAYLEPSLEVIFHPSSFGYRPGKSAHDALKQCQRNCKTMPWVVDIDIKGFFDNINHDILMDLISNHNQEKWVLMYVERWLKAGVEQEDGSILPRTQGTPQGGVVSPLLANIYLHHAFDEWMIKEFPNNPFERYADDIVIHCKSKEAGEQLLEALKLRMEAFELTLHPEKTKMVYCKDYLREESQDKVSFTFLSYTFQPRTIKCKLPQQERCVIFKGAISKEAKVSIRTALKEVLKVRWSTQTLEWFAGKLNLKIRGWLNYYSLFRRVETVKVFYYLNMLIKKWLRNKYKIQNKGDLYKKYRSIQAENPVLFYHWQIGVKG
jgi:RNA-directed DNA polymerase